MSLFIDRQEPKYPDTISHNRILSKELMLDGNFNMMLPLMAVHLKDAQHIRIIYTQDANVEYVFSAAETKEVISKMCSAKSVDDTDVQIPGIDNAEEVKSHGMLEMPDMIKAMYAADVAPVRHGAWKKIKLSPAGYNLHGYLCNLCGFVDEGVHSMTGKPFAYCPHCGAKMDAGE